MPTSEREVTSDSDERTAFIAHLASMAFLQNNFRCSPMLEARRTSRIQRIERSVARRADDRFLEPLLPDAGPSRTRSSQGTSGIWIHPPPWTAIHVQGYLAHKKTRFPRTLQRSYAYAPMAVLGGGAFFYEPGTPVGPREIGILLPNSQS